MTDHLSAKEISEYLIGDRTSYVRQHLSTCDFCGSELSRMERALDGFRSAIHDWSQSEAPREVLISRPETSIGMQRLVRSMALQVAPLSCVGAAITFVFIFFAHHLKPSSSEQKMDVEITGAHSAAGMTSQATTDAALLQQVSRQLSSVVPGPLQPLSTLASYRETAQ